MSAYPVSDTGRDWPPQGGGNIRHSPWIDLTATITAAVAGGLDADPDSIAGGLTVTTGSGTFGGVVIPCNVFGWTSHASVNDGRNEAARVTLGTLVSHFAAYNPDTYGWQLVADYVDDGAPDTKAADPLIAVSVRPGASTSVSYGVGVEIVDASTAAGVYFFNATTQGSWGALVAGTTTFTQRRLGAVGLASGGWVGVFAPTGAAMGAIYVSAASDTSDILELNLGNDVAASEAMTGIKIRFRLRFFALANIDMSALDWKAAT